MEQLGAADLGALSLAYGQHRPWLHPIMIGLSHAGDALVLASVVVLGLVWCLVTGWRRGALALAGAGLASLLLSVGVKYIVGRERPDVSWRLVGLPGDPSFPSGHALGATAVYGALGWLLARRWGAIAGVLLGVVVGLTRLYLGVHYPLDVLAGLLAGGAVGGLAAQVAGERPGLSASSCGPALIQKQEHALTGGSHAVDSEQRPGLDV